MFEHLSRQVVQAGECIFQEGELGDTAYIIEEGCVEVCIGEGENKIRISLLGKDNLIGEIALIDHQPRTATVRAVVHTVLVPIQRNMVDELLQKTDPVIQHLLHVVLERFRHKHGQYAEGKQVEQYDPQRYTADILIRQRAVANLSLAEDMRFALQAQQFELYYQPICKISDSKVKGFEALLRWMHPTQGMIPPLDFLGLAEQTGQIRDIGLWTLKQACIDWPILRKRSRDDQPFVSVNMSAAQLTGATFVDEVKAILDEYNMPANELKLELTETCMIGNTQVALEVLVGLQSLGLTIALDDFGTGFSGLDYLQRYPIHTLKIDRAFVSRMLTNHESLQIVRASIDLAQSLGMEVLAEGIETEETRNLLNQLNCTLGQGWLFGKPAGMRHR